MLRPPPEEVAELLGDALSFASAKTFHGCRVDDAGVYLREGLRRNDPAAMVASLRALLETEGRLNAIRDKVEFRLSQRSLVERDKGNLYLVLDDKSLIEFAGHYLIYGSEWMMALLGAAGHDVLRGRGIPTMLEVDLPLAAAAERDRVDLANILLTEWARRKVARHAEAPELDFAFCLRADVPPEWVVGHYHPASVRDVHYGWIPRRSARTRCAACAPR